MKRFNKFLSKAKKDISTGLDHLAQQGHHVAVALTSDNEDKVQHSLGKLGIKTEKKDQEITPPQNPTEITPQEQTTINISEPKQEPTPQNPTEITPQEQTIINISETTTSPIEDEIEDEIGDDDGMIEQELRTKIKEIFKGHKLILSGSKSEIFLGVDTLLAHTIKAAKEEKNQSSIKNSLGKFNEYLRANTTFAKYMRTHEEDNKYLQSNSIEQNILTKYKWFIKTLCKNELVKGAAPYCDNKSDLLNLVSTKLDLDNHQDSNFYNTFSNYVLSLDKTIELSGNSEPGNTEN
jgi:uncharacterized protein YqfB (UPF0267 family)